MGKQTTNIFLKPTSAAGTVCGARPLLAAACLCAGVSCAWALNAPSNLTAVNAGVGEVSLNWLDNSEGSEPFVFLCIVDPAWSAEDEEILE